MVNYQVFLSFRGPDTGENLARYLHHRLTSAGISTFLDREEIDFGQSISSRLLEAIRDSHICVPIFSPDFASSVACLTEVAKMAELGKDIRPIFFFVEPCDVRYQLGTYESSFEEHKRKNHNPEPTLQVWKDALKEIADKSGLVFNSDALQTALKMTGDKEGKDFKKAALEVIDGIKAPDSKRAAVGKMNGTKRREFTNADLKTALEAALEKIVGPELSKAVGAALAKMDGTKRCEFTNADLKADLKAALEAALEKIVKPELSKAVEAALAKIGDLTKADPDAALAKTCGHFYNDLFHGFQKLDAFISDIWNLSMRTVEEDVTRDLVGTDRDVAEMIKRLGFPYENGVVQQSQVTGRRVLVVRGMPGVGKTTLANVVYHKIKHLFQGCSFLKDVRQEFKKNREVTLQNKLIRELKEGGKCLEVKSSDEYSKAIPRTFNRSRVLILLDDVGDDTDVQLRTLAEKLTWFGEGSAIILTTTKRDVINFYKNQDLEQNQGNLIEEHEVSGMDEASALELFKKHAFPRGQPREFHENRSKYIIRAVDYLPSAIIMVGSILCGKDDERWEETLNSLKSGLVQDLKKIFEEHLDSLRDHEKARNIFLDIACFFTGVEKTIPNYMWDALGWEPLRSVDRLENMSLLRIGEENEFLMSNHLKLLGRELVVNESPDNPEGRSRLWDYQDVREPMQGNRVPTVRALRVASHSNPVGDELFDRLWNLRFLELDNVDISGDRENILLKLKWLDWRGCPNKRKLLAFDMEELVILNLCSSQIHLSLEEWDQLMQKARSLRVLNLKGCDWVKASMNIPASSHLKYLILEDCLCLQLKTASSSFENLVSFNMKGCRWNEDLPEAVCSMKALKELLIDRNKIKRLRFEEGSLPALETLSARDCEELNEVADSIGILKNLRKLFLRGCKQLKTLPPVFGKLGQLQEMDLSETSIGELPSCVQHCEKLQVLKMARTPMEAFPESIKNLMELKELDFTLCGSLSGHCDITELSSLRILRLKGTEISVVLARNGAQFCLHILEYDRDVTTWTENGERKRNAQTRGELSDHKNKKFRS